MKRNLIYPLISKSLWYRVFFWSIIGVVIFLPLFIFNGRLTSVFLGLDVATNEIPYIEHLENVSFGELRKIRTQRTIISEIASQEWAIRMQKPFDKGACYTTVEICQLVDQKIEEGHPSPWHDFQRCFYEAFILTAIAIVILRWFVWWVATLFLPPKVIKWLFG